MSDGMSDGARDRRNTGSGTGRVTRDCTDCHAPVTSFGAHRDGYLCPSCACARLRKSEAEIANLKARLVTQRINDLTDAYRDGCEIMREKAAVRVLACCMDDANTDIAAAIRAIPLPGDAE